MILQLSVGAEADTSEPAASLAGVGTAIIDPGDRLSIVDGASSSIRLFDARGRFVRSVRLPAKAQVTTIARGCIVAIERDSVGTERVRVFGMRAREASGLLAPCQIGLTSPPSSPG